jgi:hypothetical protein
MPVICDEQLAWHEAGHATMGWLLGYRVACVRLASKGNYCGWTDFGRCTAGLRSAIWDARRVCPEIEAALEILIALAGGQAEELTAPCAHFSWYDRLAIAKILDTDLGCRTDSERRQILNPLIWICDRLVEAQRHRIDALAQALLADGKVVQADIRRILGQRTTPVRSVIFEVLAALEHADLEEQRQATWRSARDDVSVLPRALLRA